MGESLGEYLAPKGDDQRALPLSHPVDERRTLFHLEKALKKLGLPGHQHTFRRRLISHALVSGTLEAMVSPCAGHVDEQILRHYMHIADADLQAYMAKLFNDGDAELKEATG